MSEGRGRSIKLFQGSVSKTNNNYDHQNRSKHRMSEEYGVVKLFQGSVSKNDNNYNKKKKKEMMSEG